MKKSSSEEVIQIAIKCMKRCSMLLAIREMEIKTTMRITSYGLTLKKQCIFVIVSCILGEGNGTPLQYSCLENPMDGGAWWTAVHGVAGSWTRLSDFTFMHWRRKWQPTPVFLPGEYQGWGGLVDCRLWGRAESDTTEAT